ncbi:MAG: FemAB family XrtA/PEP-CTERM system-associated protein [Acidobacteriota bacterium]
MMMPAIDPVEAPAPADLEITTSASESEWDQFVATHPDATGYHVWRWRRVFERAFGHETVYLAARQNHRVVGVLPLVLFSSPLFGRFAVSLPFVNYGGVCAWDAGIGRRLVAEAAQIAGQRRLSHVELRHTARQLPDLPARQHKVSMLLPLERDAGRAWDGLDRKVRNQVRKAEKSGLTARSGGRELLDRFYPVFARNMRDLGTPVYAIRFFEEVLAAFPETARVFLVEQGDLTVAGAITLTHRNTLEVPWASSLREHRHQSPNNLLYWRIIEQAIRSGRTTLDFGRSTPNEGTYQFKQQWGARPVPLAWEYALLGRAALPNLSPANPRFSRAIAIWSRLPLSLTNWIGPHIVRSIP